MARIEDIAPRRTGRWLDKDGRAAIDGCPIQLVDVSEEVNGTYGPRWVIEAAVLATGEVVLIGLGGTTKRGKEEVDNAGRRHVLSAIATALEDHETVDPVVMFRDGDGPDAPWVFRSAEADELADPAAPSWPAATGPETPVVVPGERLARAGRKS